MAYDIMYNEKIRFRLISQMVLYPFDQEILEPLNISNSDYLIKRDSEYYGFSAQYMDENAVLEFSNEINSGRQIIETLFYNYGNEAKMSFIIELLVGVTWEEIIKADLNFNKYDSDYKGVTLAIERVGFESKFRTRFATSINTNEVISLDGISVDPINEMHIQIHAQKVQKTFITNQKTNENYFDFAGPNNRIIGIFPSDDIKINKTETDGLPGAFFLKDFTANIFQEVANSGYYHFKALKAGKATVNILDSIAEYLITVPLDWYKHELGFHSCIFSSAGVLKDSTTHATKTVGNLYSVFSYSGVFPVALSKTVEFDFEVGDAICFFVTLGTSSVYGGTGKLSNLGCRFEISIVETSPRSDCETWDLKSLLVHNMKIITNSGNVKSDFLDLLDERITITNGFRIRRNVNNPLTYNMKSLFEAISAVWNLGYTISTDSMGADQIVIEPFEYFFQDKKIITLSESYDYSEKWDESLIYNYVKIGYAKYNDEAEIGLDSFNTVREYQIPITSYSKTLTKLSPVIADGHLINKVKDYQYIKDYYAKVESKSEDDFLFFLCLNSIRSNTIDDANLNTPSMSTITGIIDPIEPYNYRLTPARMFYNWQSFISSLCSFIPDLTVISNRLCVNNKNVNGYLVDLPSELQDGVELTESQNFEVLNSKKIFKPLLSVFKTKLSYQEFILIKDSLLNKGINANGYFEVFVNDKIINIFAKELKYNPITQIAEIQGWLKY